jgi:hypothetical protein
MKNAFALLFVATAVMYISSCAKCYKCHNECKVCYKQRPDTVLTISVCSDKLTAKYYTEYIDSLTSPSLGWVCNDTGSTYAEKFCQSQTQNLVNLINKKDAGLICAPE